VRSAASCLAGRVPLPEFRRRDHTEKKGLLLAGEQLVDLVANLDVADLPSENDPEDLVNEAALGRRLWRRCRYRGRRGRLAVAEQAFQQVHDGGIATKMSSFEDIISDNVRVW
jgi:hypothetical protein